AARRLRRRARAARGVRRLVRSCGRRRAAGAIRCRGGDGMTAVAPEAAPADLEGRGPEEILAWAYRAFRRVAIVASFQAESSVLIHMAAGVVERPEVVTLDTGRLPEETHELMDRIRRRYPIRLHVQGPDPDEVAELVAANGPNLFRQSLELRHGC